MGEKSGLDATWGLGKKKSVFPLLLREKGGELGTVPFQWGALKALSGSSLFGGH